MSLQDLEIERITLWLNVDLLEEREFGKEVRIVQATRGLSGVRYLQDTTARKSDFFVPELSTIQTLKHYVYVHSSERSKKQAFTSTPSIIHALKRFPNLW